MENGNKALRYARINVWLTGAILVVLCAAAALLLPKAVRTLDHAEETLSAVDTLAATANEALVSANRAADTANKLVADNADAVSEAMEKFNSVDFGALNKAINDLADIVEPLARVSNFFNR